MNTFQRMSYTCFFCLLDCQERVFGRWPKDLPVKYLDNKWRDAVCEKCTKKDNPVMPIGRGADRNKSKLSKEQMQKVWHAESDKSNDNDYDSEGDYVPNVEESVPGDTNPEYVNGFVDIKGRARKLSGRMTHKLQEDLCGCHVLYMLYDTKDPSKMKIGFSLNLESRLYTLQYDFITSGNAKVRYVKLTSAISPIKIENYILFVAYFRGYKTGLRREFVRFSEDIASELVSIICSINKFHSHSVTFEGSSKPYWIKAGWCTGAPYNGGGSTGKGIHNMFTHPRIAEYYENKRIGDYCDEPMIS